MKEIKNQPKLALKILIKLEDEILKRNNLYSLTSLESNEFIIKQVIVYFIGKYKMFLTCFKSPSLQNPTLPLLAHKHRFVLKLRFHVWTK